MGFAEFFFNQYNATLDRMERSRSQEMQQEYMKAQIDAMRKSTQEIDVKDLPENLQQFFKGRTTVPFHQIQPLVQASTGATQVEALTELKRQSAEQNYNQIDRAKADKELTGYLPALEALRPTERSATDMKHRFWRFPSTSEREQRDIFSRQNDALEILDRVRQNVMAKNRYGNPLPPTEATRMYLSSAITSASQLVEDHEDESPMSRMLRSRIAELQRYVGSYTFDDMTKLTATLQGKLQEIDAKKQEK